MKISLKSVKSVIREVEITVTDAKKATPIDEKRISQAEECLALLKKVEEIIADLNG